MAGKKSAPEKLEENPSKRIKQTARKSTCGYAPGYESLKELHQKRKAKKIHGTTIPLRETTKSLLESKLPTEILVKIFNFLPYQDIRCGVSLVCKKFYEICQDQSLVPVKDLCIYGQPTDPKSKKKGKQHYILKGREAVHDFIENSENLTYLKFKAVDNKFSLVRTALQSCPKLSTLEVIDTLNQLDLEFDDGALNAIWEYGKELCSINLLMVAPDINNDVPMIDKIAYGCPKLKNLTIESLIEEGLVNILISKESLKELRKHCKELNVLKLTKVTFLDIFDEDDIKKIFPYCNVETTECEFDNGYHDADSDSDSSSNDDSFDDGAEDLNSEEASESDGTIELIDLTQSDEEDN